MEKMISPKLAIKKFNNIGVDELTMWALVLRDCPKCVDNMIAKKCNLPEWQYQTKLERRYQCLKWRGEIWFYNKKEALNAKDYMQAKIVANLLTMG